AIQIAQSLQLGRPERTAFAAYHEAETLGKTAIIVFIAPARANEPAESAALLSVHAAVRRVVNFVIACGQLHVTIEALEISARAFRICAAQLPHDITRARVQNPGIAAPVPRVALSAHEHVLLTRFRRTYRFDLQRLRSRERKALGAQFMG